VQSVRRLAGSLPIAVGSDLRREQVVAVGRFAAASWSAAPCARIEGAGAVDLAARIDRSAGRSGWLTRGSKSG